MNSLRAWLSRLLENKLTRRILKNTGYLSTANGIAAGMNMIQGILVARLLGVNDYGILGIITLFISVINKLISFRMGELVIKYVGQYSEEGENDKAAAVFKVSAAVEIIASFLAFGLLVILAPLGSEYFVKDTSYTPLFILYGLTILVNLISESSTGLLQLNDRFREISGLLILQSSLTLVLTVFVYISQGDLMTVLLVYLVGKTINGVGLSITALQEAKRQWGSAWLRGQLNILKDSSKELINFAIHTNISSSISLITKDSEILWVSLFRNPAEAGWYKLALSLSNIIQIPVSPLPKATYPEFSREVANERWGNFRHIMRQGSIIAGGYSFIATFGLLILGKPLIRIIYGTEYLPAFPALMILLFGFLVSNTLFWRRPALLALGRPDFPTKLNFILAILKIVGVLLLVPTYGYLASSALLAGYYILNALISYWKVLMLMKEKASVE